MKPGKFIALYGVNNIGKSTQAKLLVESLRAAGKRVEYLKYPIYDSPTGQRLNNILRNGGRISSTKNFGDHFVDVPMGENNDGFRLFKEEELQKLFTQNREDFQQTLKRYLDEGAIVVAEDYTGTGIAWGVAKGLDLKWMEDLNKNLIREDLAILLQGKRHIHAKEQHHLHEQDDALVEKVDATLLQLAQRYGWKIVESRGGIEEVGSEVWKVVEDFL